jgi:hypothetical protein
MSIRSPKRPKSKRPRKRVRKKKIEISPLGVLLGIATLIGAVAAIVTLLPRTTVSISEPADPNKPFSSSVTVTNSGYLPLHQVGAELAIRKIIAGNIPIEGESNYGSQMFTTAWRGHSLGLDNQFTFALNDLQIYPFQADLKNFSEADIAIVVTYQLPYIGLKEEKIFPFIARRQTNGDFYWYAASVPN